MNFQTRLADIAHKLVATGIGFERGESFGNKDLIEQRVKEAQQQITKLFLDIIDTQNYRYDIIGKIQGKNLLYYNEVKEADRVRANELRKAIEG